MSESDHARDWPEPTNYCDAKCCAACVHSDLSRWACREAYEAWCDLFQRVVGLTCVCNSFGSLAAFRAAGKMAEEASDEH